MTNLKRDSILLKHICANGIVFDSSRCRYMFECRTDDYTFRKIQSETRLAEVSFDIDCFNTFVAGLRGYVDALSECPDFPVRESHILPGEVFDLELKEANSVRLMKIAPARYLIVASKDSKEVLKSLATDGNRIFGAGESIRFEGKGNDKITRILFLPPPRVNRSIDYGRNSRYSRSAVATDISELVMRTIISLRDDNFIQNFPDIAKEYAAAGISSWSLRVIADAFVNIHITSTYGEL